MSELSVFESAKQDYEKEIYDLKQEIEYLRSVGSLGILDRKCKELSKQLEEKTYLYNKLQTESKYVINKQKEVLDKIKEELTCDFNFEVYICNDNNRSAKTMKLGASIYRDMILEKLNELLEEIE